MTHLSRPGHEIVRGTVERRFCGVERDEEPNEKASLKEMASYHIGTFGPSFNI